MLTVLTFCPPSGYRSFETYKGVALKSRLIMLFQMSIGGLSSRLAREPHVLHALGKWLAQILAHELKMPMEVVSGYGVG